MSTASPKFTQIQEMKMLLEPKFDCPSRAADYGFFAHERNEPKVVTGQVLADAIMSGIAPEGAPFREWVPKLTEGWRFQPIGNDDTIRMFKAWLSAKDPLAVRDAMGVLDEVAYELYGG